MGGRAKLKLSPYARVVAETVAGVEVGAVVRLECRARSPPLVGKRLNHGFILKQPVQRGVDRPERCLDGAGGLEVVARPVSGEGWEGGVGGGGG